MIVFRCPVVDVHCRTCGADLSNVRIDEDLKCPVCGSTDVEILKDSEKNYIKRLIGLPGETIRIRHGDIYVNGKLAVRPPDVQNAQWQFVYDSAYVPKQPVEGVPAAWIAEEGAAKLEGATLRLTPGAGGKAEARYGRRISDVSTYMRLQQHYRITRTSAAYYPVGEIKWDVEVTLDRAGVLRLAIDEDELHYVGTVRFGAAAAKTSLHASGHGVPKSAGGRERVRRRAGQAASGDLQQCLGPARTGGGWRDGALLRASDAGERSDGQQRRCARRGIGRRPSSAAFGSIGASTTGRPSTDGRLMRLTPRAGTS